MATLATASATRSASGMPTRSAIANAGQNEDVNLNRLYVSDCRADDGPMLNNRLRFRPGPQGRAMPFAKKTSHLTVKVREIPADEGGQEA